MIDSDVKQNLSKAEPLAGIVAMKDWNDQKQCWIGTVCQAFRYAVGTEGILVYDVGSAETQVEIDDWAKDSMTRKPCMDQGVSAEIMPVMPARPN